MTVRFLLPSKLLARLVALAASSWLAFWACAPPVSLPPPTPMAAGERGEFGFAGAYGRTALFTPPAYDGGSTAIGGGEVWGLLQLSPAVDLGSTVAFSQPGFLAAGVMLRVRAIHQPHFVMGAELDGGFLWASAGIPIAVGLTDDLWVYTNPSLGYRSNGTFNLPIGMTLRLGPHVLLDAEAGLLEANGGDGMDGVSGALSGPSPYGSLGFSFRP